MKRKIYDLWERKEAERNEWIPEPPKKSRKMMAKKPKVSLPDSGASYNPRASDHISLLSRAAEVELRRERKQRKINRALSASTALTRSAAIALANSEKREMARGLFSDDEEEEAAVQGEQEIVALPNDCLGRRKTKSERKKEKKRAEKEMEEKARKKAKGMAHQLSNIPRLMKEVKEEIKEKGGKKKKERVSRRLGRYRFEEDEFDEAMQLPEDLTPSLRLLKSAGNPLEDFYNGLKKRRMIEPRDRNQIKHRKVFKKTFDKK